MQRKELFTGDGAIAAIIPHKILCQLKKAVLILTETGGCARNGLMKCGIYPFQHRHCLMTDKIAAVIIGKVAAVRHIGEAVFGKVCLYLLPRHIQQGADKAASFPWDAAKPLCAAAPAEIEKDSFCIVVCVVGGGDTVTAQLVRRVLKETVAEHPCRFLHAHVLSLA